MGDSFNRPVGTSTVGGAPALKVDVVQTVGGDGGGDSGGLTDAELRASPVSVSVSGSVAVTGTFWQATQPVSIAASVATAPYAALSSAVDGYVTLTSTSAADVIAAGGSGTRNYVTALSGTNTSATAVRVDILTGATVKHSFYLAANGGGFSHIFPFPWRAGDNEAIRAQLSGAVTDVRISATGFRV